MIFDNEHVTCPSGSGSRVHSFGDSVLTSWTGCQHTRGTNAVAPNNIHTSSILPAERGQRYWLIVAPLVVPRHGNSSEAPSRERQTERNRYLF